MEHQDIPITDAEARDLWQSLRWEYMSPNRAPHLHALLTRLERVAEERGWPPVKKRAEGAWSYLPQSR